MQRLKDITALDIAEIIDAVKAEGHNRMAQVVRMVLIDVFKEAQHAGHVPPGFNPAQATKQPRNRVNRQRLSLPELLGHKSRKMTDRYNDDRGKDWVIVDIKTA